MIDRDEDFDAQLAESGDDRPGLEDLGDDFVTLDLQAGDPEDDDFEDGDADDEDDYPEDASEDDVDLVAALYREDGAAAGLALPTALANDLEELIDQLRRVPGEAGALGVVSIDSEVFVLVRVRGRHVQMLLSDIATLATIGLNNQPKAGYKMPAASGMPRPL